MLQIKFSTGNAAFRDEYEYDEETNNSPLDPYAVASFLRTEAKHIADKIECGYHEGKIIDPNGNTVGTWSLDD